MIYAVSVGQQMAPSGRLQGQNAAIGYADLQQPRANPNNLRARRGGDMTRPKRSAERLSGSEEAQLGRISRGALAVALAIGVAGCADSKPPTEFYDKREADVTRDKRLSTFGDMREFNRATGGETGGALLVNKHLWRATLDSLAFMPLMSTDPFSGVIATDWTSNPDSPGERMKVAAYVTGLKLEARSLRVAVYREVQTETGNWVSAPVADATPRQLEDLILTRARQIRIADLDAGKTG